MFLLLWKVWIKKILKMGVVISQGRNKVNNFRGTKFKIFVKTVSKEAR